MEIHLISLHGDDYVIQTLLLLCQIQLNFRKRVGTKSKWLINYGEISIP